MHDRIRYVVVKSNLADYHLTDLLVFIIKPHGDTREWLIKLNWILPLAINVQIYEVCSVVVRCTLLVSGTKRKEGWSTTQVIERGWSEIV